MNYKHKITLLSFIVFGIGFFAGYGIYNLPATEDEAATVKSGMHGSYMNVTPNAVWSLPVCVVSTATCPGYGSVLTVEMVGGGGGGVNGGGAGNSGSIGNPYSGLGGGGGGAGTYIKFNFTVPQNGLVSSFMGVVGMGGMKADNIVSIPTTYAGQGSNTTFGLYYQGVQNLGIIKAMGGGPAHDKAGGFGGTYSLATQLGINTYGDGAWGNIDIVTMSGRPGAGLPANPGSGSTPKSPSVCYGEGPGTGGKSLYSLLYGTVYGNGGDGGHGGYDNIAPSCLSKGNGWGQTQGTDGTGGYIKITW